MRILTNLLERVKKKVRDFNDAMEVAPLHYKILILLGLFVCAILLSAILGQIVFLLIED